MPLYKRYIYPRLVSLLGSPRPVRDVRRRIIPLARGRVLEIGVGPGVNFSLYDPAKVTRLYALEPNSGMIRIAEKERRRTSLEVEYLDLPGERIPLDDASVDTVVSTFALCTIPGVVEAIRGIGRVLAPGGKFIFFEHGRSPDPDVQRWQRRLEPVFHTVFSGCHLTRDIPELIAQGGFQIEGMEQAYIAKFPKSPTYCWWGTAIPVAR
jgi:ubiquinone/menaquinone biosynthesis C-methylase UbiE